MSIFKSPGAKYRHYVVITVKLCFEFNYGLYFFDGAELYRMRTLKQDDGRLKHPITTYLRFQSYPTQFEEGIIRISRSTFWRSGHNSDL